MTSYSLWRRRTTTPSAEEPSEQKKICGALLHPLPHLAPSAPLWAAGLIYFFNVTADTAALPSPPPLIYGLHESLLILRGNTCIRCQRSALIQQPEWPFCSARPWKLGFFLWMGVWFIRPLAGKCDAFMRKMLLIVPNDHLSTTFEWRFIDCQRWERYLHSI